MNADGNYLYFLISCNLSILTAYGRSTVYSVLMQQNGISSQLFLKYIFFFHLRYSIRVELYDLCFLILTCQVILPENTRELMLNNPYLQEVLLKVRTIPEIIKKSQHEKPIHDSEPSFEGMIEEESNDEAEDSKEDGNMSLMSKMIEKFKNLDPMSTQITQKDSLSEDFLNPFSKSNNHLMSDQTSSNDFEFSSSAPSQRNSDIEIESSDQIQDHNLNRLDASRHGQMQTDLNNRSHDIDKEYRMVFKDTDDKFYEQLKLKRRRSCFLDLFRDWNSENVKYADLVNLHFSWEQRPFNSKILQLKSTCMLNILIFYFPKVLTHTALGLSIDPLNDPDYLKITGKFDRNIFFNKYRNFRIANLLTEYYPDLEE